MSTILAFRAVSFDDLAEAYAEAAAALIEGGADILIVETIFDTLNARRRCLPSRAFLNRAANACRS